MGSSSYFSDQQVHTMARVLDRKGVRHFVFQFAIVAMLNQHSEKEDFKLQLLLHNRQQACLSVSRIHRAVIC